MKKTIRLLVLTACMLLLFLLPVSVSAGRMHATAANGATVYFAVDDTIYTLNSKTGTYKKIRKFGKPYYIGDLSYHNGYVYFSGNYYRGSDGDETYVCRMKKDGTGFKKLACGYYPKIYGGKLYYIQASVKRYGSTPVTSPTGVGSMSVDGTGKKTLTKFTSQYPYSYGIVIASGRLFYICDGKLNVMMTSGSGKKALGPCQGMTTDGTYVYCYDESSVYKVSLGGTKVRLFARHKNSYGTALTRVLAAKNGILFLGDVGYGSGSGFFKYNVKTKKLTKIGSYAITQMSLGSGPFAAVHRYTGGSKYNFAAGRITTSGKSYKTIASYYRS